MFISWLSVIRADSHQPWSEPCTRKADAFVSNSIMGSEEALEKGLQGYVATFAGSSICNPRCKRSNQFANGEGGFPVKCIPSYFVITLVHITGSTDLSRRLFAIWRKRGKFVICTNFLWQMPLDTTSMLSSKCSFVRLYWKHRIVFS